MKCLLSYPGWLWGELSRFSILFQIRHPSAHGHQTLVKVTVVCCGIIPGTALGRGWVQQLWSTNWFQSWSDKNSDHLCISVSLRSMQLNKPLTYLPYIDVVLVLTLVPTKSKSNSKWSVNLHIINDNTVLHQKCIQTRLMTSLDHLINIHLSMNMIKMQLNINHQFKTNFIYTSPTFSFFLTRVRHGGPTQLNSASISGPLSSFRTGGSSFIL